jgi:hypothetical protein
MDFNKGTKVQIGGGVPWEGFRGTITKLFEGSTDVEVTIDCMNPPFTLISVAKTIVPTEYLGAPHDCVAGVDDKCPTCARHIRLMHPAVEPVEGLRMLESMFHIDFAQMARDAGNEACAKGLDVIRKGGSSE